MSGDVRVMIVEDDAVVASAHRAALARLGGFTVVTTATTGGAALRWLATYQNDPDRAVALILLDMHLPDRHGIEVARAIRGAGLSVDILAITAARDLDVVRSAISLGVVQYLIKPFSFARFAEKLEHYRRFTGALESGGDLDQGAVDAALATLRPSGPASAPKGVAEETLERVRAHLRESAAALSASELSTALEISRITARRYVEHLVSEGVVSRRPRYGSPGRPELEYRWVRP